ncbi:ThiF family adenylyltransferase [Mucilaginibacter roseus]|uniref:ThiF family adenylyltransferase n=1 Tax=Mucilaginibacter roseus TaxID=1528868 RepID=A0ABS8TXX8_9SPHI|nr:ThiF family adenylyltransferase [Mucilaginibacter roseus]MCD8739701.1 ThiF family adenylyltransferase [Mucilaginibacter roseus]
MKERLQQIVSVVGSIENVTIIEPFTIDNTTVKGSLEVTVGDRKENFTVFIERPYPAQFHNMETIRFLNKDLIIYDHVNADGSICIHTSHHPSLMEKLHIDIASLKAWMQKYLIDQSADSHYEHVITPMVAVSGIRQVMLFTDLNHVFKPGDHGTINYSLLAEGKVKGIRTATYILQSIKVKGEDVECKWNKGYKALHPHQGMFVFLEGPPVKNKRFMVEDWDDLNGVLPQDFVDLLAATERSLRQQNYLKISVLLGYPISDNEIHWQLINVEKGNFPVFVDKIAGARTIHITRLKKQQILWGDTKNCSYEYFFGRGLLDSKLTDSKILIIGIGAIGSMVAQTLCRGGCKKIDLVDYDAKEPGNVCRSEYQFSTGVNDKVDELRVQLNDISPFIETAGNVMITDGVKFLWEDLDGQKFFREYFNGYDLVIDCTADNDLAHLIDRLELDANVVNLSITNHAQELICAVNPNLYMSLVHVLKLLNKEVEEDLYNPTGCWNPTFRAGYNDISVLVQYAIKQINLTLMSAKPLRSFYLSASEGNDFQIKSITF